MAKRKIGEVNLSASCGVCGKDLVIDWILDIEAMHDCDRGCCCGECYSYYSGGYDISVHLTCPHCGVYVRKNLVDTY